MFTRERLILDGALRPAGLGQSALGTDGAGVRAACLEILNREGLAVAQRVVENPCADARVRSFLSVLLARRMAA